MKFFLLTSFIFIINSSNNCNSQNLIRNPGFELNKKNPEAQLKKENYIKYKNDTTHSKTDFRAARKEIEKRHRLKRYIGKNSFSLDWFSPNKSTPDYYFFDRSKDLNAPFNPREKMLAHSGNGFMGIIAYVNKTGKTMENHREYIASKLVKPLVKDREYCVEFYACLSESSNYSTYSLGILLSKDSTLSNDKSNIMGTQEARVKKGRFPEELKWRKVCNSFKATGGEQFVIIGNLDYESETGFKNLKTTGFSHAYFFIDDVSLTHSNNQTCNCHIINKDIGFQEVSKSIRKCIYFGFNDAILTDKSYTELDLLINKLRDKEFLQLEVTGYTDNEGSESFNKGLSIQRATVAAEYLISKNIKPERIAIKGMGEDQPIVSNETGKGRSLNRRVEFRIIE